MKNERFENYLRDRFADHESSANFEQLWTIEENVALCHSGVG